MDSIVTHRHRKQTLISSAEVLSMRNAVTGWRLHVGLMFPTPAPIRAIREWYEVVPDGVDITPLSLTIRQLTDDNMEMAVKGMEQAAELLSHYDVDMIYQSGVPPIVASGKPKFANEVQSRIAQASGLPAITDMAAVIDAMKTLNIKTVAMATPFRQFINDRLVKYLAYEDIEVISNKALGIEKNIEIRRLPIAVEYQTARQAFLDAPRRPDALYIPCGGWGSMHNIALLEQDLNTMVITWANVMVWSSLRLGKVNANIERFGRLLASIS
jgi:maleate isomerase